MSADTPRLRILLAEGKEHDQLVFSRAVEEAGLDCEIVACDEASLAASLLKPHEKPFDLVVIDLGLWGAPRTGLHKKLNLNGQAPPIIVLADQSSTKHVVKALHKGAYDYVIKDCPIYAALLPVVVKNAVERHRDQSLRSETADILKEAQSSLEKEVKRRTSQLLRTNRRLKLEIEERKRLEEDLRQNEEQFSLFMDRFPGMVYLKDEHGRFLYINRYIENAYGIPASECLGRTQKDLWPGELSEAVYKDDMDVLSSGKDLQKIEELSLGKKSITVFTQKFTITGSDYAKIIGGISIDITEYRRQERQNRLLVSAIGHTAESVFILDAKGSIQYLNPAAERSLGADHSKAIGVLYESFLAQEQEQPVAPPVREIKDRPWIGTIQRQGSGGSKRELNVIISPVSDLAGRITNYTVIEHDVTDAKALQHALERKRRVEALGMLAGGIAHDFINILQPILINAELVSDTLPEDAPEREYLEQIIEAARIGKDITSQIKMFGSKRKQVIRPVAIEPVVRDALRIISQSLPQDITLKHRIMQTEALVRTEPPQFYQLLANLCMNAVQAMEGVPGILNVSLAEVVVRTSTPAFVSILSPGEYLKLTVADTGCGMEPEIVDHIFDPLFTTKKAGKGTGLGLGVVHAIVKHAGGSIIVHSARNEGSTFEVYLPKHLESADAGISEEPTGYREAGSARKGRILLVDDNALELRSIHHMLVRMGYRVASTHDSLKALDLFEKSPGSFDLLITDQLMPEMNGDEMAKKMLRIRKDLPVIVCSGSEEALEALRGQPERFPICLSKPFSSDLLGEAIRKALGHEIFTFQ